MFDFGGMVHADGMKWPSKNDEIERNMLPAGDAMNKQRSDFRAVSRVSTWEIVDLCVFHRHLELV